jgi:hypothetical protein
VLTAPLLAGGATPQVGQGNGVNELAPGLAVEVGGTGASPPLADIVSSGSFDSGCSIRFRPFWLVSSQPLSRKTRPTVKRGCPFFTAGARLYTHCVGDILYHIAQTYLFFYDEAGQTNAMRLALSFTCWFFLLFSAHSFTNSVYSLRESSA